VLEFCNETPVCGGSSWRSSRVAYLGQHWEFGTRKPPQRNPSPGVLASAARWATAANRHFASIALGPRQIGQLQRLL